MRLNCWVQRIPIQRIRRLAQWRMMAILRIFTRELASPCPAVQDLRWHLGTDLGFVHGTTGSDRG